MADKKYVECETASKIIDNYAKAVDESGAVVVKAIKDIVEIICPAADVAPVVHGEWEWFEEWSPSTPDHPRECDDCGWRCGRCKNALADMVGGYWDDSWEKPKLGYCPECGAKMDGGKEQA